MRFSSALTTALVAASAYAAPSTPRAVSSDKEEKRQVAAVAVTIISAAATAAAGKAAELAVTAAADFIKDIASFDSAREAFTQETIKQMGADIPEGFVGAVCYNEGYHFSDPALVSEITSAKMEQGILNTDYDCFYMQPGNTWFGEGDGGFINLAFFGLGDACKFDSSALTLAC